MLGFSLIESLFMRYFLVLLAIVLLAGCHPITQPGYKTVTLKFENRDTLEFTGRGAAAGIMMSGSMGAMGIAIGVAIDEGIAKDLQASAAKADFNLEQTLKESLKNRGVIAVTDSSNSIIIKHFGFKAKGDAIVPWLEAEVNMVGVPARLVVLDLQDTSTLLAELNDLKSNPALVSKNLNTAVVLWVDNALSKR